MSAPKYDMANNVRHINKELNSIPASSDSSYGSGNGGGYNDGMEERVTALEEALKNLPTKTDFAELRADMAKSQAEMHKAIAENHRWTHGALIGIASIGVIGILGVMGTIWNAGKPGPVPQPAQPQPIIINVPQAAPAPAIPPVPPGGLAN